MVRRVGPQERQHAAGRQPVPRLEPERLVYTPDTQPAGRSGRVQPQLPVRGRRSSSAKDKIGASTDIQRHYRDQAFGQLDQGIARIEANAAMCHNDVADAVHVEPAAVEQRALRGRRGRQPQHVWHRAISAPQLDGSDYEECGQGQPFRVNIADAARGANYRGVGAVGIGISESVRGPLRDVLRDGRAHNFKTGIYLIRGNVTGNTINRADDVGGLPISYTFVERRARPR